MLITADTIITVGSFMAAITVILGTVFNVYKWYLKQNKQDEEINNIKAEQRIIFEGTLACLDGLQQLGCNHSVPATKAKMENYLNGVAHR